MRVSISINVSAIDCRITGGAHVTSASVFVSFAFLEVVQCGGGV